ncbi:MAG TPA: sugar ABC transporter permease, partial [Treponemataceae bacterium]|nr:sugar ABC transporter permease [Treponemataceae bacterium]
MTILNGLTISPFPEEYLKYFTSFLPGDEADPQAIFTVTMTVALIVSGIFIVLQILDRINKKRKGYVVVPFVFMVIKLVLVSAVILLVGWFLARHKGIPVVLILLAVIVLVYSYFTTKTVPGRHLYALGGNEKAAKLSGINTNRVLFFAYTNMGFLSAVAALVCVARFNSAFPAAGTNYELDAIGSCFIGGASAYGGTGTVGGSIVGAIFMGVLNNGMSILGIDANWQKSVKGIVLLAAVVFDLVFKKRAKSR